MKSYQKYSQRNAFTLVELVVAATILIILTSIWFYNYTQSIAGARDSVRATDLWALSSQLSLYKRERWAYPFPGDRFSLLNGTSEIVFQWRMDKTVALSTASNLPLDPELDIPYFYSVTRNRQEYQLAASIENNWDPFTHLLWDYKSIAREILPNIIIARENLWNIDIRVTDNLFLFHNDFHNLPYDFQTGAPSSDGSSLATLIADSSADYWQNTDYRNCDEIELSWKNITSTGSIDTYQILSSTWTLVPEDCNWVL